MGCNMAWRLLPNEFSGDISLVSKKVKENAEYLAYLQGSCYIAVGKSLDLDSANMQALLQYVAKGNEFFISANGIDTRLLDSLGLKRSSHQEDYNDSLPLKRDTYVRMADTVSFGPRLHGFYYYPFSGMFSAYDQRTTTVLGLNQHGEPNYVVVRYGKGKFYFHLAPETFTNYFLLTADNNQYYSQVLSYLNKDATEVLWGDIYRFRPQDDFSAFAIFWKNPPLKYALVVTCALMLFYIAFGSKRKRQLIPVLPVNSNASLSFVRTIGNLYLQKKDNRNIAVKKITYFLEFVRSRHLMNTQNLNPEFVLTLSRKTGVPESRVQQLVNMTDYLNNTDAITDHELFEINNLVDEYYKN